MRPVEGRCGSIVRWEDMAGGAVGVRSYDLGDIFCARLDQGNYSQRPTKLKALILMAEGVGVGVLLGLIPLVACGLLNAPFAVALQNFQLQFMSAHDKRLKFTSEILNNMKIKLRVNYGIFPGTRGTIGRIDGCAWRELCKGMAGAESFDEVIELH
ncbi:hypothetical protein Tco_0568368 [Tanacetum coccineum]